ncbi:hypothetical protein BJV74DRAFT_888454 [Russula compacta]|nr:hypothetical protein BJV74DRAFT_888454 [Russula compacta]
MVASDDEYGFDDLVLDDRTLAVLDETERSLAAVNPSTSHPRSPPEQQPTKRLKTAGGWVPLHGQQPHERPSPSNRLTKSKFSLEDTDLPEITISNGFYSGPGRFFVGSQQSEPPASPTALPNSRERTVDADSDVIMLSTPTQQLRVPGRVVVAHPNDTSRKYPPAQPSLASQSNRERVIPTNAVVPGPRIHPIRHPTPTLSSANVSLPNSLTRSSSFNDSMRAALRSALSEVDGPALRRSSSGSPSPLSAPRASFQEPVPNPSQGTTHSQLEHPPHFQRREKSLPPRQHLHPHRQSSQHRSIRPQPELVSQTVMPCQRHPIDQNISATGDLPAFRDELESLRSQLKRQNAEQQRSLDHAISEKRSKIGEVEILRTTLQKANATHIDETDKLREAKEALEAAQVAAQKKQEAELERLRTQLMFKQHEIEASRRAAPRAPVPSQLVGYSQTQRSDVPRTPRRHPAADPQSPSPQRPLPAPPRLSKTRPLLPGFVNAFTVPSPKKGKGTVHTSVFEQRQRTREHALDPPPLSPPRGPVRAHTHPEPDEGMEVDGDEVGGQATGATHLEVDFHMDLADGAKTPQPISGFSKATTPFDWVNWMRQLVLAHAMSSHAPSTVQLLLAQPPLGADHQAAFHSACTSLMGAAIGSTEYEFVVRMVANSFAQIANILLLNVRLKPLIPTLNLLGHLVISLPSFVINLLKPTDASPFLQTICAIIVNVLQPSNTNSKESEFLDLGREVFCLLDAVTYSLPTELAVIPQTAGVLSTMLSNDHPLSFLENSTRTLSYLSIRASIFRSLLSFSEDTPESARDFAKLPQVDRMCALLMDPSRTGAAGHSIRASVLTTFVSLAMVHEDALIILSESPFFIPSLVKLLADLSTALWEEDTELTTSTALLSELVSPSLTVAGIVRGMLLLHYVIFRMPNGPAGLRARLQAAPPRHFNGIGHQFVVALGRLSFAEPPDEVSVSDRMLLEQLADPARDVMDLVVAGPESESVWSLFQEEEGGGVTEEQRHVWQSDDGGGGDESEDEEDTVMQGAIEVEDMEEDSSYLYGGL